MPNKRKAISNIIDLILIIVINGLVAEAFLRLLSLFISRIDIVFYVILIINTILLMYNLSNLLNLPKTIGKKIASILVKDENKKITWKDIIIFMLICMIIGFI